MAHETDTPSKRHSEAKRLRKEERKRRRQEEADAAAAASPPPKKKKKKHKRHDEHRESTQAAALTRPSPEPLVSPLWTVTRAYYLPLAPIAQLYPLQGLMAEHLSPMCMTYSAQMRGVVLCYENARLEEPPPVAKYADDDDDDAAEAPKVLGECLNEGAACWLWVTADFLVYRPEPGMWVEGYVVAHSEGHLGLLLLNVFNASIERARLPRDWRWIAAPARPTATGQGDAAPKASDAMAGNDGEAGAGDGKGATEDEGYWEDGKGDRVERWLRFRVRDWIVSRHGDREKGFFGVEGTLLTEEEEKEVQADEAGS